MIRSYQIRAAEPSDAPGIVAAIREGFAPALVPLFIYGCPGVTAFVREQIAVQSLGGDTHYTVAQQKHEMAGCIELRRCAESLFLNYITVRPAFRSCGLGKRLLRTALEQTGTDAQTTLSLDVLESNTVARNWYEQLGFHFEDVRSWWILPLVADIEGPVLMRDFAQAQACQQIYGFSRFHMTTTDGDYEIGRLGAEWFRLTAAEALNAPGLGAALGRIDSGRQILLLTPGDGPPRAIEFQKAAVTCRMSADLKTLRHKLCG